MTCPSAYKAYGGLQTICCSLDAGHRGKHRGNPDKPWHYMTWWSRDAIKWSSR